ncbi:hypothetical protein MJG53_020268 [Ovis ammon polii x Ovis aries]|uniref:Uncharacterized protein n=2 Tax=Ovis TaxID=9935 RepID=A0AAD4UGL0_OVIAM|nr:hypothetical protein MG293_005097 [Ovis ammon polii]KAI4554969.1 hypothetical protein MJG53_020268 [Ovis ammon polii x Ovis aries]
MPFSSGPNPTPCRANTMPFFHGPNLMPCGPNLMSFDANQMPGRASPNVFGADPSVYGAAVGGASSRNPPIVFLPVPFSASNERFNYSDQMYGNFHNAYNDQSIFNTYGGDYSVGYNSGLQEFRAPFANCKAQKNEAAPYSNSFQGPCQPVMVSSKDFG